MKNIKNNKAVYSVHKFTLNRYYCSMHLKIGHGQGEGISMKDYVVLSPKMLKCFFCRPMEKLSGILKGSFDCTISSRSILQFYKF